MDELTTASTQSVSLVVAFTKGRGTLGYLEVSCGSLLFAFVKVFGRTHLGLVALLHQIRYGSSIQF